MADLEQQNLMAAIQQAQAEAANNPEAQAIRQGREWLELQRRKLTKQNFPCFMNRSGEDWDGHKQKMDNAFKAAMHHEADGEGRKHCYISSLECEAHGKRKARTISLMSRFWSGWTQYSWHPQIQISTGTAT